MGFWIVRSKADLAAESALSFPLSRNILWNIYSVGIMLYNVGFIYIYIYIYIYMYYIMYHIHIYIYIYLELSIR